MLLQEDVAIQVFADPPTAPPVVEPAPIAQPSPRIVYRSRPPVEVEVVPDSVKEEVNSLRTLAALRADSLEVAEERLEEVKRELRKETARADSIAAAAAGGGGNAFIDFLWPWGALILLGLLLAAIAAGIWYRKRKKKARRQRPLPPYQGGNEDGNGGNGPSSPRGNGPSQASSEDDSPESDEPSPKETAIIAGQRARKADSSEGTGDLKIRPAERTRDQLQKEAKEADKRLQESDRKTFRESQGLPVDREEVSESQSAPAAVLGEEEPAAPEISEPEEPPPAAAQNGSPAPNSHLAQVLKALEEEN